MKERISQIKALFLAQAKAASNLQTLQQLKSDFFGKKGFFQSLMDEFIKIQDKESKKEIGALLNDFKKEAESLLIENEKALTLEQSNNQNISFDPTLSVPQADEKGNLHFYTKFAEEIENVFLSMGFSIFEGPEVEDDFHNFTALNIPKDHPARDMQDTLWLEGKQNLMRTHTSSVQIRTMLAQGAPLAGISLGRVFRHEATDATHEISFTQCEGLVVDKNIGLGHLFGTAKKILQEIFQRKDLDIRTRPGFFPFVVPGVEIDMRCVFCTKGCSVCKHTTWIEVFPGGLVHPNVLRSCNVDPEKYTGFAFGFGVERLAMLRHKINDIRLLKSGNINFLKQF